MNWILHNNRSDYASCGIYWSLCWTPQNWNLKKDYFSNFYECSQLQVITSGIYTLLLGPHQVVGIVSDFYWKWQSFGPSFANTFPMWGKLFQIFLDPDKNLTKLTTILQELTQFLPKMAFMWQFFTKLNKKGQF